MLDDRTRPSSLHRALAGALCLLSTLACSSPRELRAGVDEIERQWAEDTVVEDSLEDLVETLRELGDSGTGEPTALASIVKLSRVAANNPSFYVRAEALRSAWKLAETRPVQALREDRVDSASFSAETRRYEQLSVDPVLRDSAESLALIASIGNTRFPVSQLRLGLDLADLVVSQSLWGATPAMRAAFAEHAEGSAMHALTCTTLTAAAASSTSESVKFLRQAAVEEAAHLHIDLALSLIGAAFDRDPETLVALAAMKQLELVAESAPPEQLEVLLDIARRRDEPALSAAADALEARMAAELGAAP